MTSDGRCSMTTMTRFSDRTEAGRILAEELEPYRGRRDVIVLALPRGGVPVGYEVARRLGVPLDVLIVRKLGVPFQPELAMGAVASGGIRVVNDDVVRELGLDEATVNQATAQARVEVERRERAYRGNRPAPPISGRTVILVDDGLATGATMRAAVQAVRKQGALRVVVAVPVAPPDTAREFEREADEFRCVIEPSPFYAIGTWYTDFAQVQDGEVRRLLTRAAEGAGAAENEPVRIKES